MKIVRAIWVLALSASVGILLGSLPGYWARINGVRLSTEFSPVTQDAPWLGAPLSLGDAVLCLALAVLLFAKKPNDRMALFLSYYLILFGIVITGPLETFLPFWFPSIGELALEVQGLIFVISMALILIFPNGLFMPRWTRWLVIIAILEIPVAVLSVENLPELYRVNSLTAQILYAVLGVLLVLAQGVQVYRYRKLYTPLERQQTKWVVYGFVVSYLVIALVSIPWFYWQALPPGTPAPWWLTWGSVAWQFSLSILPLAFTIAILRYRLYDIDIIIRRTLIYSILTAILAIVYLSSIVLLQQLFRTLTGAGGDLAIIVSTLAVTALFNPLRHRVQDAIDHRFYRRKYNAQQVLARFAQTVRDEVELEKLTGELLNVANETMQPTSVSLWLKK